MKNSFLKLWLTRIAWGVLAVDLVIVPAALSNTRLGSQAVMLLFAAWLFLSLLGATVWLMAVYRNFFRSWLGWSIPVILFLFGNMVVQGVLPIKQPNVLFFFSVLAMAGLWLIPVATGILLWYRDVGLSMIGWGLAIFVWLAYFAWRIQGNLFELMFSNMSHTDAASPVWWLGPLVWVTGIRVKLSGLNLSQHSQRIYSFVTFAFEALSHDKRRGVL